jgi:hypothetical protein
MATNEMNFKGGVVIIGSLLWDGNEQKDEKERYKWRTERLDMRTQMPVSVKIRYGRESKNWKNYTMILSNHSTTEFGQGVIVGFKEPITGFEVLKEQAFAMAKAEGIWKAEEQQSLNAKWGTVGLLVNPNINNENRGNVDIIRKEWKEFHQNNRVAFDPCKYCIEKEGSVINDDGFLQLDWTEEMNDYDFLIATAIVPKPKKLLTPRDIASKIKLEEKEYFHNNITCGIKTFQDDEIKQIHERK